MGAAYWVLSIALLSTAVVCLLLKHHLDQREQARFREASDAAHKATELHLRSHAGLLQAIRGLYLANPGMTQEQWKNFFKTFQLREGFPGLLDVGLALRVPAAERRRHIASVRQKGLPNYRLPYDSAKTEYFPLVYLQEAEGEPAAERLGWDAGSDPRHLAAMEQARDTGRPISTGKLPLPSGDKEHPKDGFIVYLPVYSGEETPVSVEERKNSLRGFVVGSYLPERLWADVISYGHEPIIDLEIFEGDQMEPSSLLFDNDQTPHFGRKSKHTGSLQVAAFGRKWTFFFSTVSAFDLDSKRYLIPFALLSGMTISLLLFGIAWTQAESRAESEELTTDLRRSEEQLRSANDQLQAKIAETERAQSELQLAHAAARTEHERLSVTLRSMGEAVLTTDRAGRIVLANQAAETLTGWAARDLIGRRLEDVLSAGKDTTHHSVPSSVEEALASGNIVASKPDATLITKDGRQKSVSATAAPIRDAEARIVGAVLVAKDITQQARLEAELLKARKLESLGLLASGLAHDFNTLLTGIMTNVSVARMFAPEETNVEERLAHAEKSCLRAKELTERLLLFAKSGPPTSGSVPIAELLKDTTNLALTGSACRSEFAHAEDPWPVRVDEGQICQVIYDLVANAVQAMPEGGTIHVSTRNLALPAASALPLPRGDYVQVTLRDEGAGIAPDILPRIFDPYFTTKERGSGLALATAYFILQRQGGLIVAESTLGKGTSFHLYLPAASESASTPAEPLPSLPGIHGRILLMDDEPLIRNLGAVVLKRLGYDVQLAKDGDEAIQLYNAARAAGRPFSAVILDLVVQGGLGGREAMKRLLAADPAVKGIAASGYLNDPVMAHWKDHGFVGVISKPFHASGLAKLLAKLLRPGPDGDAVVRKVDIT